MMKKTTLIFLAFITTFTFVAVYMFAKKNDKNNWFENEVVCPFCGAKNNFSEVGNYGEYIYNWPSRYQNIFWPHTDSHVMYSCRNCNLTAFMYDFLSIPLSEKDSVMYQIKYCSINKEVENYFDIPMSRRMAVAEKVYSCLDKDIAFWSEFYRIYAYHLDMEGNSDEAAQKRKIVLKLTNQLLGDSMNQNIEKELRLTVGAMLYFLNDKMAAEKEFHLALKSSPVKNSKSKLTDDYLTSLVEDYIAKIDKNEDIVR